MLTFKINIDPDRARRGIENHVQEVQQKIGMDLLAGIVLGTPVDTGRAAGNWQVAIGAPASGTLDRQDPQGAATIAAGSDVIQASQAFSVIYINNNLPYIEPLERGHSGQAPQGMVQTTLDRVTGAFA